MQIDLLVSPGCLSRNETEQLIRNLIAELAPGATLQMTVVDSVDMAANLKFAGSPTVKIDGRDLEPEVDKWLHFGLGWRTYMDENGQFSKVPPVELIRKAIIDVRGKTASPE